MSKTLTVTEAARAFSDLINRVRYNGESTVLLKGGKPVAKIIPISENLSGQALAEAWAALPHLSPEDAASFETDLAGAKKTLPSARDKWA